MKDEKNEIMTTEKDKTDSTLLPDEKLEKVTGGGFGEDIPRVPEAPIDDVKDKF